MAARSPLLDSLRDFQRLGRSLRVRAANIWRLSQRLIIFRRGPIAFLAAILFHLDRSPLGALVPRRIVDASGFRLFRVEF